MTQKYIENAIEKFKKEFPESCFKNEEDYNDAISHLHSSLLGYAKILSEEIDNIGSIQLLPSTDELISKKEVISLLTDQSNNGWRDQNGAKINFDKDFHSDQSNN